MIIENPTDLPGGTLIGGERSDWYIYFLWFRNELVYIGQTVNPFSRIAQHQSSKTFDRYTYHLIRNTTIEEVLAIERANINYYKPPYNDNAGGVIKHPKWCIQGSAKSNDDVIKKGQIYSRDCNSGIKVTIYDYYDGETLHTYRVYSDHVIHSKDGKRVDKIPYKSNKVVKIVKRGNECRIDISDKPVEYESRDEVLGFSTVIGFGSHKGKMMGTIIKTNRSYAYWLAREGWNGPVHSAVKKELNIQTA